MTTCIDPLGNPVERPAHVEPAWRVRCSAVAMRNGMLLMTRPTWSGIRELPGGGVELIPEEIIEVSWVGPSILTADTVHWYHLDVLRKLGIVV